ncbi:unnamed protein product, partial [Prorocentrum cordatum]
MRAPALLAVLLAGDRAEGLACQELLTSVAAVLDEGDGARAAAELEGTRAGPCRQSGYWWLLRGRSEALLGRDARSSFAVAEDLYATGLLGAQSSSGSVGEGGLERLVRERRTDVYDFDEAFGFPVYSRLYAHPELKRSRGTLFRQLQQGTGAAAVSEEVRAWVTASVADFARLRVDSRVVGRQGDADQMLGALDEIQAAVVGARVAWSAPAAAADRRAPRALGPHLTALYLVRGTESRLCLRSQRQDAMATWRHGARGGVSEAIVREGELLLFHRALEVVECAASPPPCQDAACTSAPGSGQAAWAAFDVWFRSPLAEDAGVQEDSLSFASVPRGLAFARKVLRGAPAGNVTLLFPTPLRAVRSHYAHEDPAINFLARAPVSWRPPLLPLAGEDLPGAPPCPEGLSSALDHAAALGLRSALLDAAAGFLSDRA